MYPTPSNHPSWQWKIFPLDEMPKSAESDTAEDIFDAEHSAPEREQPDDSND